MLLTHWHLTLGVTGLQISGTLLEIGYNCMEIFVSNSFELKQKKNYNNLVANSFVLKQKKNYNDMINN